MRDAAGTTNINVVDCLYDNKIELLGLQFIRPKTWKSCVGSHLELVTAEIAGLQNAEPALIHVAKTTTLYSLHIHERQILFMSCILVKMFRLPTIFRPP